MSSSGELQSISGAIDDLRANRGSRIVKADVPCLPQKPFFCLDLSLCGERYQTLPVAESSIAALAKSI